MSWDSYVDTNLTSTGQLDKACIWGIEADADWTATAKNNLSVSKEEVKALADSFSDTKDVKTIQEKGFLIAGVKYFTIRCDDTRVYGKKDKTGILVYKTTKALVIGHYPEGIHDGNAVNVLETIGAYLTSIKY